MLVAASSGPSTVYVVPLAAVLFGFAIACLVFSAIIGFGVLRLSPELRWPFRSPQVAAAFVAALGAIPVGIGLHSVMGNWALVVGAAMIIGAAIWGVQSEIQARNEKNNLPMVIPKVPQSLSPQPEVEPPAASPEQSQTSTRMDSKGRIILGPSNTPEYLTGFFRNELAIHAERRTKDFIGKWMRVSGNVEDISEGYPKGTVRVTTHRSGIVSIIFLRFDAEWHDRVMLLQRNQTITVLGSIRSIESYYLHLEHCELE